MADTGRAAAKHLALLLRTKQRFAESVPAIAVSDSDQLAVHQRPADQGHLPKACWRWRATQCRRYRRARLSGGRISPIAVRPYSPMARRTPTPTPPPTTIAALIESHENDFDGRIYTPDEGVAPRDGVGNAREQADLVNWPIRRTIRRRRRFRHHRHAARAGPKRRHQGRDWRRSWIRESAKAAHAAGQGVDHQLALAANPEFTGDRPFEATFVVEQLSDGSSSRPDRISGAAG